MTAVSRCHRKEANGLRPAFGEPPVSLFLLPERAGAERQSAPGLLAVKARGKTAARRLRVPPAAALKTKARWWWRCTGRWRSPAVGARYVGPGGRTDNRPDTRRPGGTKDPQYIGKDLLIFRPDLPPAPVRTTRWQPEKHAADASRPVPVRDGMCKRKATRPKAKRTWTTGSAAWGWREDGSQREVRPRWGTPGTR